ncbi:MAG TPA: 3'-5' exonuclease [Oculatellaceae cyanobacterium]|jgi:hypothetical protein
MTSGEKRVARALENDLDDDHLLWYDVPIGKKQLHPDFIILHPEHGLFILEVKDWKLENIQRITKTSVQLVTQEGIKEVNNPLRQARNYALAVCQMLERDATLVYPIGSPHQGKLILPYGYGVVFTNITRKNFEQSELTKVFEPHLVICKNDIAESVDALEFNQQIWNLSAYNFGNTLGYDQINRIRWHIFPELRIGTQLSLFPEPELDPELEQHEVKPIKVAYDLIKIMDLQQEQLARSLGDGHRVIHGVAGSGKTLILVYRCQYLAEQYSKPILCLCFNVSLASKLRYALAEKNLTSTVKVRHFHGWCVDILKAHQLALPDSRALRGEAFVEDLVHRVIQGFDTGVIAPGQYGAVIIDEGHDFKPEWLKLTTQMVDPETNSLLVLYDDAQSIYEKKQRQNFSFKSVGIQAQGRTTIFKLNYRNTAEVLTLAYEFARVVLAPPEETEDDTPVLIQPQSAGRRGKKPELIRLPSFMQEVRYLNERVQQLHERGTAWNDMAIIYRTKFMGERIKEQFYRAQIPVEWVNATSSSRTYQPADNSIKLITMHSSKGLEFPVVFIPGLGYLPNMSENADDEARLLYVAMTRAIEQLVITYHQQSKFTEKLQLALNQIII